MDAVRNASILPVEARGLVFEAGGRRLIDGIDLTIGADAFTAIVGPNRAGQSLTLRLLHGPINPTDGQVLWAGRPAAAAIVPANSSARVWRPRVRSTTAARTRDSTAPLC